MYDLQHDPAVIERIDPPISVSHFFRVFRAYLPVIGLSLAAVALGYVIIAVAVYILAPSQRVTSMPFRLEFDGADKGTYPNGTKFSSAEIVTTPILLKTYDINGLSRFTSFPEFSRSIFVTEASGEQEALARFYRSRLSDPRLLPVDRERIEREYALKLANLSKSDYSISYMHTNTSKPIPDIVIRKVLHDVLHQWAAFVSNEQHVLKYRVTVLSPDMMAATRIEDANPIIAAEILRAKTLRVMLNIEELRKLPASELVRSKAEGLSLNDISIRLDELVRFRLEPLIRSLVASRLDDRPSTIQFLETQLSYDERMLEARQQYANAAVNALSMYTEGKVSADTPFEKGPAVQRPETRPASQAEAETVMPQLSDSFIDRLIQLTASAADQEYRQSLATQYQRATTAVVPIEAAVAYDRSVLALARSSATGSQISREFSMQQIAAARQEVRQLVVKIREIHAALSATLNSSTQLMTVTTPPASYVERTVNIRQLALYGIISCFIALPLILLGCLIHNRIREEEKEDVELTAPVSQVVG